MINHRHEFVQFSTPTSVGVEVGTDKGVFAAQLMRHGWQGQLVCVDNWKAYAEIIGTRIPDMLMAVMALMPWHGRIHIMQCESVEAAFNFPWWLKPHVDFVYIDAAHDYASVKSDIELWWPIVKEGGILAGHDWMPSHQGVRDAVEEFSRANDRGVNYTLQDDIKSWYVFK